MVVQSVVLSIMNYCLPIYGSTNNTLLHRVQKLQNLAPKICIGGGRTSDHAPSLLPFITRLQWLKVKDKVVFDVPVNVFKMTNNVFPKWLLQLPTVSEALHNIHARQRNKLYVPHTHTGSGGRPLTVLGPRLCNSLPAHLTDSRILPRLMNKLTIFLNTNANVVCI